MSFAPLLANFILWFFISAGPDCKYSIGEEEANVGAEIGNIYDLLPELPFRERKTPIYFQWRESCEICLYFDITPDGMIKIASKLDREEGMLGSYCRNDEICRLKLEIVAIIYRHKTVKKVNIETCLSLVDANDNPPVITWNGIYRFLRIKENTIPADPIGHFAVTDKDEGKNGKVTCQCRSPNFILKNRASNYELYYVGAQPFDHEQTKRVQVQIECSDHGPAPLRTLSAVTVYIEDENDCSPRFDKTRYVHHIPENTLTRIENAVKAEDGDSTFPNNHITYFAEKYSDLFRFHDNGTLEVLQKLDYEFQRKYEFKVFAFDGGIVPNRFSATAEVTVHVLDQNDNFPRFQKSRYYLKMREDAAEGSIVGKVTATDEDSGNNGKTEYSMRANNSCSNHFSVRTRDGAVVLQRSINAKDFSACQFSVIAQDCGIPPLETCVDVLIGIEDVNDHKPQIIFPVETLFFIKNYSQHQVITTIVAYDGDIGLNALLSYDIVGGEFQNDFKIDEISGQLTMIHSDHPPRNSELVIRVRDNGAEPREATITLQLVVERRTLGIQSTLNTIFISVVLSSFVISSLLFYVIRRRRRKGRKFRIYKNESFPLNSKSSDHLNENRNQRNKITSIAELLQHSENNHLKSLRRSGDNIDQSCIPPYEFENRNLLSAPSLDELDSNFHPIRPLHSPQ